MTDLSDRTQDVVTTAFAALEDLAVEVEQMTIDTDTTLLAWADMVVALDLLKTRLKDLQTIAQDACIATMGTLPEVVSSDGIVVERKVGQPRKAWDHHGLAEAVANRIAARSVDMDTGEVLLSPVEQMTEMLRYAGVAYWKVTKLRDININPDRYCDVGEPATTLAIHKKDI